MNNGNDNSKNIGGNNGGANIGNNINNILDDGINNNNILPDGLQEILQDSPTSRCTEVRTLEATPSLITDENGLSSNGIIHSILTRRLGLIVGCCLGIIVFIVLISVLGYLKLKKQRIDNNSKRQQQQQQQLPPEYISYRHFSIPNDELHRTTNNTLIGTPTTGMTMTETTTTCLSNNSLNITAISGPLLNESNNSIHHHNNNSNSNYNNLSSGVLLGATNLTSC